MGAAVILAELEAVAVSGQVVGVNSGVAESWGGAVVCGVAVVAAVGAVAWEGEAEWEWAAPLPVNQIIPGKG